MITQTWSKVSRGFGLLATFTATQRKQRRTGEISAEKSIKSSPIIWKRRATQSTPHIPEADISERFKVAKPFKMRKLNKNMERQIQMNDSRFRHI